MTVSHDDHAMGDIRHRGVARPLCRMPCPQFTTAHGAFDAMFGGVVVLACNTGFYVLRGNTRRGQAFSLDLLLEVMVCHGLAPFGYP
ncbi:hypothetical protein SDC9_171825 [bioreactor metagenome]|uniref:Uncharacterized protein n=1 Tax=bioreactor metagenome TaxID=1076179 RepID=A0A645GE44_9ZZZZ